MFREASGKWSTFVIWAKNPFTLGRVDYQRQYEPILYGWKDGADHYWCGSRLALRKATQERLAPDDEAGCPCWACDQELIQEPGYRDRYLRWLRHDDDRGGAKRQAGAGRRT